MPASQIYHDCDGMMKYLSSEADTDKDKSGRKHSPEEGVILK